MSLVHDMAECIVGDITPSCPVDKEEKHKRERVMRMYDEIPYFRTPEHLLYIIT